VLKDLTSVSRLLKGDKNKFLHLTPAASDPVSKKSLEEAARAVQHQHLFSQVVSSSSNLCFFFFIFFLQYSNPAASTLPSSSSSKPLLPSPKGTSSRKVTILYAPADPAQADFFSKELDSSTRLSSLGDALHADIGDAEFIDVATGTTIIQVPDTSAEKNQMSTLENPVLRKAIDMHLLEEEDSNPIVTLRYKVGVVLFFVVLFFQFVGLAKKKSRSGDPVS
jgi:hypothetical protein